MKQVVAPAKEQQKKEQEDNERISKAAAEKEKEKEKDKFVPESPANDKKRPRDGDKKETKSSTPNEFTISAGEKAEVEPPAKRAKRSTDVPPSPFFDKHLKQMTDNFKSLMGDTSVKPSPNAYASAVRMLRKILDKYLTGLPDDDDLVDNLAASLIEAFALEFQSALPEQLIYVYIDDDTADVNNDGSDDEDDKDAMAVDSKETNKDKTSQLSGSSAKARRKQLVSKELFDALFAKASVRAQHARMIKLLVAMRIQDRSIGFRLMCHSVKRKKLCPKLYVAKFTPF
jgi:hypothetical protein